MCGEEKPGPEALRVKDEKPKVCGKRYEETLTMCLLKMQIGTHGAALQTELVAVYFTTRGWQFLPSGSANERC